MRDVESPLFAVIVCRKFAAVAAFSWHWPHAQVMNDDLLRSIVAIKEWNSRR
jgi:hypothetical protein